MDAKTVLLTANTETVYAMGHLDLKATVRQWSRRRRTCSASSRTDCSDTSPTSVRSGRTRAKGGKFLVLPPGFAGSVPEGYFVSRSPTYSVTFAVRGFQVDGKTDQAVALMKQIKIYPLRQGVIAAADGVHERLRQGHRHDVSGQLSASSSCWRCSSTRSRRSSFGPLERSQMQAIGIEKGKPFDPDAKTKALAVRGGTARRRHGARQHLCLAAPGRLLLPRSQVAGRSGGMTYTFVRDGAPQIDARNNVYYMAAGNSPAMMEKNVGQGSQYLWTYRDADGEFLDGAKNYRLHILPNIPAEELLVGGRLRRAQPVGVAERPAVSIGQQLQPIRRSTRTARSTSSSARMSRRRRATGSRPFPARAGSRSSASTA